MQRSTLTLGIDATADVELGEGPRGDGGVDELCRDRTATMMYLPEVSEAYQSLSIELKMGHGS